MAIFNSYVKLPEANFHLSGLAGLGSAAVEVDRFRPAGPQSSQVDDISVVVCHGLLKSGIGRPGWLNIPTSREAPVR